MDSSFRPTGWDVCSPFSRFTTGHVDPSIMAAGGETPVVTNGVPVCETERVLNRPILGRPTTLWIPNLPLTGMTTASRQPSPGSQLRGFPPIAADRPCWPLYVVVATWPLCHRCGLRLRRLLAAPRRSMRGPWYRRVWIRWRRGDAALPVGTGEGAAKIWRTRLRMTFLSVDSTRTRRRSTGALPKPWLGTKKLRHSAKSLDYFVTFLSIYPLSLIILCSCVFLSSSHLPFSIPFHEIFLTLD